MANPNIYSSTTIYGQTDLLQVSTTPTTITANSSGSGKIYKVNCLFLSNTSGTADVDVSVNLVRGTNSFVIAKTISVPADASLVALGRETPVYLKEGDSLSVFASSGNANAICSYEELS